MIRRIGFPAALAALLALAAPVEATHAVNHRYIVLGYVRDGSGRPRAPVRVRVTREKTGLVYATTSGRNGFYAVIVHLHDEDLLDALDVTAGAVTIRVEARFNPLDTRRPRGTRVDFSGANAMERQDAFARTLGAYLAR